MDVDSEDLLSWDDTVRADYISKYQNQLFTKISALFHMAFDPLSCNRLFHNTKRPSDTLMFPGKLIMYDKFDERYHTSLACSSLSNLILSRTEKEWVFQDLDKFFQKSGNHESGNPLVCKRSNNALFLAFFFGILETRYTSSWTFSWSLGLYHEG